MLARTIPYLSLAIGILILSQQSSASEARFPTVVNPDGVRLIKTGEYRYTYRFFFDLYDAALFADPDTPSSDLLKASAAYHLEFKYLRKIDKSMILESAGAMLMRNLSDAEYQSIAARIDQLNAAYRTVNKGDVSSLTYLPKTGTSLRINGNQIITIPGQDFAQLYFRIWLGDYAISDSMKAELLGGP